MERFMHGGDIYQHPGVIDFSASLNPLGMPPRVRELLRASVDAFAVYPDPHCRVLTQAIAAFEGVDAAWVQPAAGATDVIARLCQAVRPQKALLLAPCYTGYEQALEQVGCTVELHSLSWSDRFDVTDSVLARITADIDLVFLANPNNPTGLCLRRELLTACIDRAREAGAVLALDECFIDLTGRRSSTDLVAGYPQLVIIKALTKSFALAGLRVGYALCSDAGLLERMERAGQPWAVSVPAQLAGAACLDECDYLAQSRMAIAHERTRLAAALAGCGWAPLQSEANYLLFQGPPHLAEALLRRGILIRCCENFRGLDERWYRVAVRSARENDRLMAALKEASV